MGPAAKKAMMARMATKEGRSKNAERQEQRQARSDELDAKRIAKAAKAKEVADKQKEKEKVKEQDAAASADEKNVKSKAKGLESQMKIEERRKEQVYKKKTEKKQELRGKAYAANQKQMLKHMRMTSRTKNALAKIQKKAKKKLQKSYQSGSKKNSSAQLARMRYTYTSARPSIRSKMKAVYSSQSHLSKLLPKIQMKRPAVKPFVPESESPDVPTPQKTYTSSYSSSEAAYGSYSSASYSSGKSSYSSAKQGGATYTSTKQSSMYSSGGQISYSSSAPYASSSNPYASAEYASASHSYASASKQYASASSYASKTEPREWRGERVMKVQLKVYSSSKMERPTLPKGSQMAFIMKQLAKEEVIDREVKLQAKKTEIQTNKQEYKHSAEKVLEKRKQMEQFESAVYTAKTPEEAEKEQAKLAMAKAAALEAEIKEVGKRATINYLDRSVQRTEAKVAAAERKLTIRLSTYTASVVAGSGSGSGGVNRSGSGRSSGSGSGNGVRSQGNSGGSSAPHGNTTSSDGGDVENKGSGSGSGSGMSGPSKREHRGPKAALTPKVTSWVSKGSGHASGDQHAKSVPGNATGSTSRVQAGGKIVVDTKQVSQESAGSGKRIPTQAQKEGKGSLMTHANGSGATTQSAPSKSALPQHLPVDDSTGQPPKSTNSYVSASSSGSAKQATSSASSATPHRGEKVSPPPPPQAKPMTQARIAQIIAKNGVHYNGSKLKVDRGCENNPEWDSMCPHLSEHCGKSMVTRMKCRKTCGACKEKFKVEEPSDEVDKVASRRKAAAHFAEKIAKARAASAAKKKMKEKHAAAAKVQLNVDKTIIASRKRVLDAKKELDAINAEGKSRTSKANRGRGLM